MTNGKRVGIADEAELCKTFQWLKKVAKQNDANACFDLAVMYENGEGVHKNIKKSRQWFVRAAELGDGDAMIIVGESYLDGYGLDSVVTRSRIF